MEGGSLSSGPPVWIVLHMLQPKMHNVRYTCIAIVAMVTDFVGRDE